MGCFSGCPMSAASDQKLFCELCSPFCCSLDEFVGERVVSASCSSASLAPPQMVPVSVIAGQGQRGKGGEVPRGRWGEGRWGELRSGQTYAHWLPWVKQTAGGKLSGLAAELCDCLEEEDWVGGGLGKEGLYAYVYIYTQVYIIHINDHFVVQQKLMKHRKVIILQFKMYRQIDRYFSVDYQPND